MTQKKMVGKTVSTALDDLPYGSKESMGITGRVQKAIIPQGVTRKRILRDITLIAWPSFVELVLTQLTSMADQVMVGRLPGEEGVMALASVGLATLPKFLLMTLIMAMNVGTTAIIARSRGQQNREKANQVFRQALIMNLVLSAVCMVVGLMVSKWLILLMGGDAISAQTLAGGVTYLNIQLMGFIPLCLGITVTAALRGVGDTKTPMIYNTVANVVNLICNYIMIYGKFGCPKMGIAGASLATVVGQCVAFVIAMSVALGKKHYVYVDLRQRFRFDWSIMKNVASIGTPSMIEQLFMRIGMLICMRAIASLGDTKYATYQIAMNIQSMSFMIGQAFGNASTTLMGQSMGKRRSDMAAVYMANTRMIGCGVSLVAMTLMIIFRHQIIGLYNTTPEVIAIGASILLFVAFMQPLQCDQFITAGGLRGAGDTRYTAVVMFVTTLGVRSLSTIIMVYVLGWDLWGACAALCLAQGLRTLLVNHRYMSGKWKAQLAARYASEAA